MAAGNPFSPGLAEAKVPNPDTPEFAMFGVQYAAEALWDLLAALPCKAEATLAQRRLEESVFWANRAAKPFPGS